MNPTVDPEKQHNTSETKKMMYRIFGELYSGNIAEYDCFIQMVFRDAQDFINVKEDPHYKKVVMPDHGNFADTKRTTMVTGWIEKHIVDGRDVSAEVANGVNGH
jgi:EthD domain